MVTDVCLKAEEQILGEGRKGNLEGRRNIWKGNENKTNGDTSAQVGRNHGGLKASMLWVSVRVDQSWTRTCVQFE